MKRARLIIADDHQIVRQGLRTLIDCVDDLAVVAEAQDGAEAERLACALQADLLVLDIALPVKSGVQVLESLRALGMSVPVLLFSMHPPAQYVDYARRKGAQGFVGKDEDSGELLRAIRRILGGRTRFPRMYGPPIGSGNPFSTLSRREAEVMRGLLNGERLGDIAVRLDVGATSITTYRRRLLDKLGVQSNTALAALAARYGQI